VSADRLTDRAVDLHIHGGAAWIDDVFVIATGDNSTLISLATEVQASRKLVADLLAMHVRRAGSDYAYCPACDSRYPCATVRLIEADRG